MTDIERLLDKPSVGDTIHYVGTKYSVKEVVSRKLILEDDSNKEVEVIYYNPKDETYNPKVYTEVTYGE